MKKKKLILAVAILTLIMVVVGATYAYFVAQTGAGQSANINVQAGTTDSLKFEVSNDLNIYASVENFAEGQDNLARDTNLKATLKPNNNTNEATYNYYVYLDISKNELEYTTEDNKPELLFKVTKPDGTELTAIDGLEYKSVVNNKGEEVTGFDITTKKELITIADNYEIHASGSELTQEWNIEIILVNLGSDQNKNTNKKIEAEAKIQEEGIKFSVLKMPDSYWDSIEQFFSYDFEINEDIKTLIFEDKAIVHSDAVSTYDFSKAQDKSIMGYSVKNVDDSYTLYINSNSRIRMNGYENYHNVWFAAINGTSELDAGSNILSVIKGLENVDFSQSVSMSYMFYGASSLTALDLRNFDTSQVTSMGSMFSGASSLIELDISNMTFDSVSWYDNMFYGVPNNIHIKVKDEAAKTFIEARLAEANITEGVVEVVK